MRENDPPILSPEAGERVTVRKQMTIGGLIIVIGGVLVALISLPDVKMVVIGFTVALLGAGIVHPDMVINFVRGDRK